MLIFTCVHAFSRSNSLFGSVSLHLILLYLSLPICLQFLTSTSPYHVWCVLGFNCVCTLGLKQNTFRAFNVQLCYTFANSAHNFWVSFVSVLQNSAIVQYPPSVVTLPEMSVGLVRVSKRKDHSSISLIYMRIQVGPFMDATELNVVKNDSYRHFLNSLPYSVSWDLLFTHEY